MRFSPPHTQTQHDLNIQCLTHVHCSHLHTPVPEPTLAEGKAAKKGAEAMQHRCCFIGVYNYKGGAMKSTSGRELAAALAVLGKKVAIVDADAQCNLTSFFLSNTQGDPAAPSDTEDEPKRPRQGGEEDDGDEEMEDAQEQFPVHPRVLQASANLQA